MHRYVTPRALGLALLALALMAAMVLLGLWQLGVYDSYQSADAQARLRQPAVPLGSVLGPDQAFPAEAVGLPVRAAGRYVGSEQAYAVGLPGTDARYAVLTPLVTATGSAVLVLRGGADSRGALPPTGNVTVLGILEPATAHGSTLSRERLTTGIKTSSLVDGFREDLYDGYLIASPPTTGGNLTAVQPPTERVSSWSGIRNLLYAVQWWVFAGFVAFMWWRIVNDAAAGADRGTDAHDGPRTAVG